MGSRCWQRGVGDGGWDRDGGKVGGRVGTWEGGREMGREMGKEWDRKWRGRREGEGRGRQGEGGWARQTEEGEKIRGNRSNE